MTTRDLINASLKRLGVLDAAETAAPQDMADGLSRLNDLIDGWATERLTIYTTTRTTWPLVSGTATYTIGPGGDCNIARPVFVSDLNFIDTTQDPDLEMGLSSLTTDAWSRIPQKGLTSTYPTSYYYNPTYPLASVTFWMIPTSSALQGVIYTPTAVTELGLNDTINLPPGYRRFLRDNLAVELAPEFDLQPSQSLVMSAMESKANIKRANITPRDLYVDPALRPRQGRYNIFSDTP
jgi:hypothetical protein